MKWDFFFFPIGDETDVRLRLGKTILICPSNIFERKYEKGFLISNLGHT